MAIELMLLGWSVPLLLLHIAVQGASNLAERGVRFNAGPRDGTPPPLGRVAGRAERALRNYRETWPAFIALALGLAATDRTGGIAATGASLWFAARSAYLPLYVFGVPWLRSVAWGMAALGLGMMLVRFL